MKCCHHHAILPTDPAHTGDDFTVVAQRERRARAAHAHSAALLLSILGGLLLFGVMKHAHRNVR